MEGGRWRMDRSLRSRGWLFVVCCRLSVGWGEGVGSSSLRFIDSAARRSGTDETIAGASATRPGGAHSPSPRFLDSPAPRPGPDAATAAAESTGLLQPHRLDSSTQRHAVPGLMERRSGPKPLGLPPNPQRPNTLTTPAECSRDRRGGNPSSPRPSRRRCGACASGR